MNKFIDFTDEEIKVLQLALYIVIDNYEKEADGTESQYMSALKMYDDLKEEAQRRGLSDD